MLDARSLGLDDAQVGTAGAYLIVENRYVFVVGPKHDGDTLAVIRLGGHCEKNETAWQCTVLIGAWVFALSNVKTSDRLSQVGPLLKYASRYVKRKFANLSMKQGPATTHLQSDEGEWMISVLINGAGGKMGKVGRRAIEEATDLALTGVGHRDDDLPTLLTDLRPDVVLDFTVPEVVYQNCKSIIEAGCHPVIGTSGLTGSQVDELRILSSGPCMGGIVVPNFAITAVLMMKYAEDAARYLPNVEIIDLHHDEKKDAPSGTGVRTAEMIADSRRSENPLSEEGSVPIHSVRLPGLVSHHEVIFGTDAQVLRIQSDQLSRDAFISGIQLACRKVTSLKTFETGLESII